MPQLLQFFRTFSGFVPLFKLVAMVFHKRVELGYLSASNEEAKFCANISFLCLLFKEASLLTSSTNFTRLVFAHCQGNVFGCQAKNVILEMSAALAMHIFNDRHGYFGVYAIPRGGDDFLQLSFLPITPASVPSTTSPLCFSAFPQRPME